jgi:hypothetical protein
MVILLFLACDQSFNPKGEFEATLAVYGVLSTDTSMALVRVVHTYDPSGFNPLEYKENPSLTDAVVSIFKEDTAFSVRDTTIARTDTTRYGASLKAFVAQPFPVEFGKRYSLVVNSPTYGEFIASMTMPGTGAIVPVDGFMLDDLDSYKGESLFVYVGISPITRGYLLRAYAEFEVMPGGQPVTLRSEVPSLYHPITSEPLYPSLRRRVTPEGQPGLESTQNNIFQINAFIRTRDQIANIYPGAIIKRFIFALNQVEPNFYNYYSSVNGFRDPYSLRLDEPSYSNINGGEGVFGGFTHEELSHDL